MRLKFEITDKQFDSYKRFVENATSSDYYTLNPNRKHFFIASLENISLYKRVSSYLEPLNQHAKLDNATNTIALTRGCMIDEVKQIYSYATYGGNVWGVTIEDNKPILFFLGNRKLLIRMPFLIELAESRVEPILFTRASGISKKWYEYGLVSKMVDEKQAIDYFSGMDLKKPLKPIHQFLWDKWVGANPNFENLVLVNSKK